MEIERDDNLNEIVAGERLRTYFQPIVHLNEGRLLGFESLSRGPAESDYESPEAMFREARRINLLFELERECQKRLLQNLAKCSHRFYMFFNLEPILLESEAYRELPLFANAGAVCPDHFVIELTERHNIHKEDALRRHLHELRQSGFKIALDDIGSGYSDLDSIIEYRPEFLKVSNRIIRDIEANVMKQKVVSLLLELSESFATIIAEGIETSSDLCTLRSLGVRYGQGFLLARPGPHMDYINQMHLCETASAESDWDSNSLPQSF